MTKPSEVDSESLQAVRNLRSKFELLASSSTSVNSVPAPGSTSGHNKESSATLLSRQDSGSTGDEESPRGITTFNELGVTSGSGSGQGSPLLRPSSSLTDLRRRPPPPPPRGKAPSRSPSPAPSLNASPHARPVLTLGTVSPLVRPVSSSTLGTVSPLLRPVPAPPMPSSMNMAFLAIPAPQAQVGFMNGAVNGAEDGEDGKSIALLKNRFNSSPAPIPPPRTSSPSPRPYQTDSNTNTTPTKLNPLTRPVPPPTPSNSGYLHHGATNNNNLSTSTSPQPSGLSKLASSSLASLGRDTPPPSGLHSRTPSISISTSSSSTSAASTSTTTHTSPSKPAIPPRPPKPDTPLGQLQDPILPVSHTSQSPEHISLSSPIPVERSAITMLDNAPPIPARGAFKSGGGGEDSPQSASGSGSEGRLFPPPPRHRASLTPGVMESITSNTPAQPLATPSSLPTSKPAPPLPIRRSTVANTEDRRPALHKLVSPPAPPAPPAFDTNPITPVSYPASNPHSISSHTHNILSHILPHSHTPPPLHDAQHPHPQPQRKHLSRLPPPPTRTIGPGDKLPPARRPTSPSSDDDSGADEEDPRASAVEHMPDATRSNRRGPVLSFRHGDAHPPKIQLHPYSGTLAISGTSLVLGQGHTLRIYDLSLGGDSPVHVIELKDVGVKEGKICAVEFCPGGDGDRVWVGTKEGHIFIVDVRSGDICTRRLGVHLYPITQIFRYGESMLTLDESGKTLIFSPSEESAGGLVNTLPRVTRTTEKQDFARLLGGKLWTAARGESSSHGGHKIPIIRVFDPFNPASTGRSLIPTEHVGAVTSGTILPSHPGHVYLGHEEGFISIWSLEESDHPRCIEVVKVSLSDVLCLEGVNDRLWAGGRNGMIAAYDVQCKPWVVRNCWTAHPGLPVVRLVVDYLGVEKGRLCVVSVGRDEAVRFWDGLLGLDWIDKELLKAENEYSTFRDVTALIISWNCDSARPDALTSSSDPPTQTFLSDALNSVDSPDIIAFGFQEVIDLESRKMTAKNVLLGSKKKEDMGLSEKVTGAYRRWYDRLVSVVRASMPPDVKYSVVHTESLVGLFSCIFIKASERERLSDVAVTTVKRGMGGRYGNKGGIVARFVIGDSSVCIINSHLAAGQNAVRRRNADAASILEEKTVFPVAEHPLAYVGGGDGTMVLDHEIVFFHGDMNYRIEARRDAIIAAVRAGDYASLIPHDQLVRELKYNRAFRLRGFSEGPLTFAPTYKYDPRSNEYDTSEKHRSPAWCDRVLWRSRISGRVRQVHYRRYEANVSDHRPVSAAFRITVKSLRRERREEIRRDIEGLWVVEQGRLLDDAREFYRSLALI